MLSKSGAKHLTQEGSPSTLLTKYKYYVIIRREAKHEKRVRNKQKPFGKWAESGET